MKTEEQIQNRIQKLVDAHRASSSEISFEYVNRLKVEFHNERKRLLPNEKTENIDIVDLRGQKTGVSAPRWLCHLVGLRHTSAHVCLYYRNKHSKMFILQVRSWTKADSPGHLDVSVGGHVKAGKSSLETAWSEMREELGLSRSEISSGSLTHRFEYPTFNSDGRYFHNNEWCDVYTAEIQPVMLRSLHYDDGEVVGSYLCPESELRNLLVRSQFPVAAALKDFIKHKVESS